jgi:hypothetical protein
MKKYWSRFQLSLVIFGLAILVTCLPVAIQKAPRIKNEVSRLIRTVEHAIKWDLNPGPTVTVADSLSTQPLSPLHSHPTSMRGTLRVNTANPRYFTNDSGKAILLTGSHTWQNLQDSGTSYPLPAFDYIAYLDFLQANNHNFFRLWTWEQSRWSLDSPNDNFRFSPLPYQRAGKALATDGLPKFDLTQFNQDYFDRLRERVVAAEKRGIYVSVMLFNGWSVVADKGIPGGKNPWRGHPFNRANNINNIDGDLNRDESGEEVHELVIPALTAIQEAYVRKVIDTVNDLDNVLYEVSNESHPGSIEWQYHLVDVIRNYEAAKPKQHPIGVTPTGGEIDLLYASPSDWVSTNAHQQTGSIDDPPVAAGRKVVLADTDHICGVCGDRQWVWKSFTRGENPVFMDVYDGEFHLIVEQVPPDPLNYYPWVNLRRNLGYVLSYANRMHLVHMVPHPELASSGYCLADPVNGNGEYLVYVPSGGKVTVELSTTQGRIQVEWLDPETGSVTAGVARIGGGRRSFVAPFEGDAVLYLKKLEKLD